MVFKHGLNLADIYFIVLYCESELNEIDDTIPMRSILPHRAQLRHMPEIAHFPVISTTA